MRAGSARYRPPTTFGRQRRPRDPHLPLGLHLCPRPKQPSRKPTSPKSAQWRIATFRRVGVIVRSIHVDAESSCSVFVQTTSSFPTHHASGSVRAKPPGGSWHRRYLTPTGPFKPTRLTRSHFSREWDNIPMPHSILFTSAGHAIHGTGAVRWLGSPVSHGCVRLAGAHAATLFRLIGADPANTRIEIVGTESVGSTNGRGALSGITSFDPLREGIMAGPSGLRRTP
jgi:lipoprotein-anchoring transpeptidase ErfK/SrfK